MNNLSQYLKYSLNMTFGLTLGVLLYFQELIFTGISCRTVPFSNITSVLLSWACCNYKKKRVRSCDPKKELEKGGMFKEDKSC